MKICKNCNSKIEDDALVCPYCGCVTKKGGKSRKTQDAQPVSRNVNSGSSTPKKRKTWLWVLGWICVFPIPLTILMLRSKKINKTVKIAVIAVAWLIYLVIALAGSGSSDTTKQTPGASTSAETTVGNIKDLSFTNDKEVTVKVGKTASPGYLKVSVKSSKEFTPDDVVFVSENPEVARIEFDHDALTTSLYFNIIGVDGGETNVYAMSADGSVKSGVIHVIVPEPIRVEAIELTGYKTDLVIGETTSAKATVSPSDAEDKTLTWTSSDDAVVTVDEKGNIVAVGGGTATITATATNGVSSSFDATVDGTKTLMKLNVRHSREDDVNIGDEWSYDIQLNGERTTNTVGIAVGDNLSFYAQITESDDNPDVGSAKTSHTVTEEDLANGFEVKMDVYVTENGGRNSGKSAHFVVTYTFSPNN